MKSPEHDLSKRLDALLDQERNALLSGAYTELPGLLEQKIQLASLLQRSEEVEAVLTALRAKTLHNQKLLDEAMAAFRNSAERVIEMRGNRRSISTYDHVGKKRMLKPDPDVSVEKNA